MPATTLAEALEAAGTTVQPPKEQRKPIEAISVICSKGTLDMAYPGLILANAARMSGIDAGTSSVRKGAVDAILAYVDGGEPRTVASGNTIRSVAATTSAEAREIQAIADEIAKAGGTPLAVAKDGKLLGVVHLKDIVKGGIRERFAELRRMGIRTVMITGDNPMTAAAIAAEAGVDDFLAQATPEDKLKLIRDEQSKGKLVAMCGDGTNDAPALAQADVGVAMNTGTQAAREAGNMVDLDSNPTKLIEVVEIGKGV